jgi:protein-S-isoprenylcysteine O-methyltransferase Ste14
MTTTTAVSAAGCSWIAFFAYWIVSAFRRKAVRTREPRLERLRHMLPLAAAYVLLFGQAARHGWLAARFASGSGPAIAGVLLTAVGLGFAVWARYHLADNWSAEVSIRQSHELIGSGPYRAIRHPIYTGMLLGIAGTALAIGEVRGLLALAIALLAFYLKARKEERWLSREFGARFEEHARRTGMFLPPLAGQGRRLSAPSGSRSPR